MAEDIYSLVQRQLSRDRGGKSQYQDPLTDMLMSLPGIIQGQADRELVKNKESLNTMLNLTKIVNNEEGFTKLDSMFSNLESELKGKGDMSPYLEILGTSINNKKSQYDIGKAVLSDINENKDVYEDLTSDEIQKMSIEDLNKSYNKALDMKYALESSNQYGFKFPSISMSPGRASKAIDDYIKSLDGAIKYHTSRGVIPEQVADALAANNFDFAQKEALKMAEQGHDNASSLLRHYNGIYERLLKNKDNMGSSAFGMAAEDARKVGIQVDGGDGAYTDISSMLSQFKNKDKTGLIDLEIDNLSTYNEMKNLWSPVDIPTKTKVEKNDDNDNKSSLDNPVINKLASEWISENPSASDDELREYIDSISTNENINMKDDSDKFIEFVSDKKENDTNDNIEAAKDSSDIETEKLNNKLKEEEESLEKLRKHYELSKSQGLTDQSIESFYEGAGSAGPLGNLWLDTIRKIDSLKVGSPKKEKSIEDEFLSLSKSKGSNIPSQKDIFKFKKDNKLDSKTINILRQIYDLTERMKNNTSYSDKQISRYNSRLISLKENLSKITKE